MILKRRKKRSDCDNNHYNWKGGRYINKNGYVMILVSYRKYIPEHVLVMEKYLGRKLKDGEIVHHIDESFKARSNNDIGNLQLTNRPDHNSHHFKGRLSFKKGSGKGYYITSDNRWGKWVLRIRDEYGKYRSSGYYNTKEEALVIVQQK